jgi:hypothetical protein
MILQKLYRKAGTFTKLPGSVKMLFAEALFTSAWVKLSLAFFPFKRVLKWHGSVNTESTDSPDEHTLVLRRQIKQALQICKTYAPWPTECYTISLTGKLMLKKRDISSTLYIGFKKEEDQKTKGHAWLRANDTYISGIREARGFKVSMFFS